MEKKLSEMDFDEEGTVKEIDENLKKQVAGMGIRVGKNIRMATKQPIKGPVVVEVDKSLTSLGLGIAEKIIVEVGQDENLIDGASERG
ncbi:MAG: ferrous iron transport protein A [Methanophagales archaeon]|nr:ferrous iron transport protein A [Methanophagales archaeon]